MRANKQLGQHFLNDKSLLAKIAACSEADEGDVVLEIGSGPGGLTRALLDSGASVVAVERDKRMGQRLNRELEGKPFALVEGDALELDWAALVEPWTITGKTWRVVGNIPYYITSPLLDKALTAPLPTSVTFLVQEEVANRLVAEPGTSAYGALSVGIQAVADVEVPLKVGRAAFSPSPKVDSAVVHLVPRDMPIVPADRLPALRRLTVDLFSYRRKRIHRSLREARGVSSAESTAILDAAAIDPDLRPEAVDVAGFVRLMEAVASTSS
jgi:16S rRNA (adenine1518-N6/adenine1519-N6)-dimethyltransferase